MGRSRGTKELQWETLRGAGREQSEGSTKGRQSESLIGSNRGAAGLQQATLTGPVGSNMGHQRATPTFSQWAANWAQERIERQKDKAYLDMILAFQRALRNVSWCSLFRLGRLNLQLLCSRRIFRQYFAVFVH